MRLHKITDLRKELQTDKLHLDVLNAIEQFVHKYWRYYYPQYKGEVEDLVYNIYNSFVVPKEHRNKETFSELDRFEYSEMGGEEWSSDDKAKLLTYVKNYVKNRLIDYSRTDKGEMNYSNSYDEEGKTLDINRLSNRAQEEDESYDSFSSEDIKRAIETFKNMDESTRKTVLLRYSKLKKRLPDYVIEAIDKVIGASTNEQIKASTTDNSITELENSVRELLPNSEVLAWKVQKKPAIKIIISPEDNVSQVTSQVDEVLDKFGYKPHVKQSKQWYFVKDTDQVKDSDNDPKAIMRFNDLKERVGDKPQHYLNQIEKCGPDKRLNRIETFYRLAVESGLENTAKAIKEAYPESYSLKEIQQQKEEAEKAENERIKEEQRLSQEQARVQKEQAKQDALDGGPTYCEVVYNKEEGDSFFASANRLFASFAKKHPNGFVIEVGKGDTSVGAPYERRDGRIWTLANKYTVSTKDKTMKFDIACLSNEGYDPNNKSGWSTGRDGKKWYVGKSFGWFLNGSKRTWAEIKKTIESSLNSLV